LTSDHLSPGFADPVTEAQACFRAILDAIAHPGRIQTIHGVSAPAPLCGAAGAVLLTLVDHETPLWLDPDAAASRAWIAFHTGAPAESLERSMFAMALSLPDLTTLPNGTDETPETAATIILQVKALNTGRKFILAGPGLREPTDLLADGLPSDFEAIWQRNHALFPRGIDLILCAGSQLTALPRGVTVKEA
jgi:alpha-D-ribose 1-methylphosphonate 5-triphosphate synthase subunit PhnH